MAWEQKKAGVPKSACEAVGLGGRRPIHFILVDNDVGIFTTGFVPRISIEAIDARREVWMVRLAADIASICCTPLCAGKRAIARHDSPASGRRMRKRKQGR